MYSRPQLPMVVPGMLYITIFKSNIDVNYQKLFE